MKASFISLITITGLLGSSLAAPTIVEVESRATVNATAIMSNFYAQVQTYTGTINSTLDGINAKSTTAQNTTAQAAIQKAVTNIASAANTANTALNNHKRDIDTRGSSGYSTQDQQIISGYSANIVSCISGTMNRVQGHFGKPYVGGLVGLLVGALALVFGTLDNIVGGVLVLAGTLIGGVLQGVGSLLGGILFGHW
ncbi:hypothetical protein EYC84_008796 [Monilinia fructicola]|uniref:Uncharacterized protein n=1 Tax=Monilinia fructicola TaxID=38448 RepID=A0A5M9JGC8_MONFR|nr:hypothetical protein EYC84_008796 [Monilinia fructicola]